MNNGGYMSIKQNQKNVFNGHYIGCDSTSGLEMPNWEFIAKAFGVKYFRLDQSNFNSTEFQSVLKSKEAIFFDVQIDPEQTYYPKITSFKNSYGQMESNPIHIMEPSLTKIQEKKYIKYI